VASAAEKGNLEVFPDSDTTQHAHAHNKPSAVEKGSLEVFPDSDTTQHAHAHNKPSAVEKGHSPGYNST
jgi:hypothetical protein